MSNMWIILLVCIIGGIGYALIDGAKHGELKSMAQTLFSWAALVFLYCLCTGQHIFSPFR
jgi:hypothetical protein